MRRAVFLDRDGTLVEDLGYPCHYDRHSLFPFTAPALRQLRDRGYLLVVVTNQSCVARGLCTREQIETFHRELRLHLGELGADVDAVYACYYHAGGTVAPWNRDHPWRKPAPGMLLQAAKDLGIDLARSFMVGDKRSDIEAGRNAGCRTVLVRSGQGAATETELAAAGKPAELSVDDLLAAAHWIVRSDP